MIERSTLNYPEGGQVLLFCGACAALVFLNLLQGIRTPKEAYSIAVILVAMICLENILVPGAPTMQGFLKWFMPITILALYCLTAEDTREIWMKFVNIVFVFAVPALVLYVLGSILHIIPPTGIASFLYDKEYKQCSNYLYLFYEAQKVQGATAFGIAYRNTGIFLEAPMYNLVLCIAFAAEFAFRQNPRKMILIVLGVSILSTFTSTGIIFLLLMALIYVWNSGNSGLGKIIKVGLIPAAICATYFIVKSVLAEKLDSTAGSGSMSVRTDHLRACLQMALHNPIIGYGFANSTAFYQFTKIDQGLSIGLPALLGRTGLPIFLMYLVPYINLVIHAFRKNRKQMYFWAGTFFCFFLTASVFKLIFILLLCTQLLWKEKKNNPILQLVRR